ncbi:MAG: DEAD/DEAH box helicase [Rhodoferax sp.]|nr:DEAD/DEAH box helicase [Rhodoferax sp.]
MAYNLFPYQKLGAEWLADHNNQPWMYLADEPGLGKSAQCLEAINKLKPKEALIVCPAIARLNWFGEAEKFLKTSCKLTAYSFNTTFTERDNPKQRKVNPRSELLRPWPLIIIDEAHYLANASAQRTKAVYLHIAQYGARVWCLSGTPAKKDAGDMYTWLRASGIVTYSYEHFISKFCILKHTKYGQQIMGSKNVPELRALWASRMLRRKKADVLPDMPPLLFCDVEVEPGPVDAEKWFPQVIAGQEILNNLLRRIEEQNAVTKRVIEGMSRYAIDTDPTHTDVFRPLEHGHQESRQWIELQKVQPVSELIIDELESKHYKKIVIFCYHKSVIHEMRVRLAQFNPLVIDGSTHPTIRFSYEKRFQNDDLKHRVIIGQIDAMGVSITLTEASEVAVIGPKYTPTDNTQAVLRVHRIGQKRPVRVRFFYVNNGSDKQLQRILMRRTQEQAEMFDPLITGSLIHVQNPLEGL